MRSQIEVIINAESGAYNKQEVNRKLAEIFDASNVQARITLLRNGGEIADFAQSVLNGKAQTVVAGGGDGTVNAVASALVGSNKTLGVLPLGTLNHFARDLAIPLTLEDAARNIVAGYATSVDVGEVNGRIFLNNSSLGLYPGIVHQRERQQRLGYGKWPAFLWAAVKVLGRYPFLDVRLSADSKEIATRTPFVFVGNNKYEMKGLNVGGRSGLDAGHLCLYLTNRTGRLGLLRLALLALFGKLREDKDLTSLYTKEVLVETGRRQERVSTDGEVVLIDTPLHYRVYPAALRVIVPEHSKAKG